MKLQKRTCLKSLTAHFCQDQDVCRNNNFNFLTAEVQNWSTRIQAPYKDILPMNVVHTNFWTEREWKRIEPLPQWDASASSWSPFLPSSLPSPPPAKDRAARKERNALWLLLSLTGPAKSAVSFILLQTHQNWYKTRMFRKIHGPSWTRVHWRLHLLCTLPASMLMEL